jgi:ribosome-interacting GTPase 1
MATGNVSYCDGVFVTLQGARCYIHLAEDYGVDDVVGVNEFFQILTFCQLVAFVSLCRVHNADIHLAEDYDVDDLVDVIEGSRVYVPAIYVVNKIDQITLEELEVMDKLPHYCPVSGDAVDLIWLDHICMICFL